MPLPISVFPNDKDALTHVEYSSPFLPTDNDNDVQPHLKTSSSLSHDRPTCNRRPPRYLNDYICNITIPTNCLSPTYSHGTYTSYPLANIISYNRLSNKHNVFLTSVDSKVEPTIFY